MTTETNGHAKTWRDYLYKLAVQMPLVAVLAIFLYMQREDEARNREMYLLREAERQDLYLKCNEELKATLKEINEFLRNQKEKGSS